MKKILFIILGVVFFTSCNDFLELIPKDQLSDNIFWKTTTDLSAYLNTFYQYIPGVRDYSVADGWDTQVPNARNVYLWGESIVPASGGGWSFGDWANIRSCNYFLTRHQSVKEEHSKYIGEARFFRAMFYFDKLRLFGAVPFYSKDLKTNDEEELYKPRDSRSLVVDSILADLDYAIKTLPEKKEAIGRLHKDVASALASRVALYEGTYLKYRNEQNWEKYLKKCVTYSEQIMNKDYSIWMGANDPKQNYYQLFIQEDMTNNPEIIYAKIYDRTLNLISGGTRYLAQTLNGLSYDFASSYLCVDGKPISISPLYEGHDSIRQEMKNRDPRMAQTIDNPDHIFTCDDNGNNPFYHNLPLQLPITGYQLIKFHSPYHIDWDQKSQIDHPTYRYAEILLNFAEAKAELGSLTNSDLEKSINLIRKRVGMPKMTLENVNFEDVGSYSCGYPISNLIREIRRERRIELIGEGFRGDDIVRWKAGKLLENPNAFLGIRVTPEMKTRFETSGLGTYKRTVTPAPDYLLVSYIDTPPLKWNDRLYLRPIPKDQLKLNPNLTQNPGWEDL